jgi:hypothetical protein
MHPLIEPALKDANPFSQMVAPLGRIDGFDDSDLNSAHRIT